MDVQKIYSQALKQHKEKNFDAALELLDELKRLAPNFKLTYMLEADVWRDVKNPTKETAALFKLLPLLDFSLQEDKNNLGYALSRLKGISIFKEFAALMSLLPRLKTSSPEEKEVSAHILYNLGRCCSDIALCEESKKFFLSAVKLSKDVKEIRNALSAAIGLANYLEKSSAADFRMIYDEYEKTLAGIVPYPRKFYSHGKIRVGFLSADFCRHVVMTWSWSLLTKIDKKNFVVYCYSNGKNEDAVTEDLIKKIDGWRNISDLTDEAAAALIREDEIDILFDLSGYTVNNRLSVAAYHPASVQISGIGHTSSTGLSCFDYFLSDVYCAGDAATVSEYFTEKVIKLPHSHFCYDPPSEFESAAEPPCLRNGYVTFGSFNRFLKVGNSILHAWKKILDAVPNSRLLLKHKIFSTDDGKNFIGERLKSFGFDLSRVEMRGYTNEWLAEYADVDIALDTFPYTGGVTTCEALYMGVPVVSIYGSRLGTRFGLSILKNVGLGDLAANSIDDYIKLAVALAGRWNLLDGLRKNLRGMMKKSPLMDSRNYLRAVEEVFIKILRDEKNRA